MSRRDVRVVIGEGGSSRRGLLRFVLDSEGFEVVGEADRHADLVHVVALLKPDVIVLDDGIGVAAVGMVREIAPHAKIVLVWPQAVVPIGGDARVEPAHVVQKLGPVVERVAAALIGSATETYRRPDWVDRVRKDPTALRELLSAAGVGASATGLDVSQLQRRIADAERRERERERAEPASVAAAGTGAVTSAAEPVVHDDPAAVVALPPDGGPTEGDRERARRIGLVALGAAAASAALVFALSLGGSRIPVLVLGERPGVPASPSPPVISPSPPGDGEPDGDGGNDRGDRDEDDQVYAPVPGGPTVGPGNDTTPVDQDDDGGADGGGDTDGGPDGTDGGTDGNGGGVDGTLPGRSALYNPYGGPPGILGFTPKPWMFLDGEPGFAPTAAPDPDMDPTRVRGSRPDVERAEDRSASERRFRSGSERRGLERHQIDRAHPSARPADRGHGSASDRGRTSGVGHPPPGHTSGHGHGPPGHAREATEREPGPPAHAHKR